MALSHSPRIATDGLILYLDAANTRSYPGSGTTWFDLSGFGNNHTLVNSPTFSSGTFTFNGSTQGFSKASAMSGTGALNTVQIWMSTSDTKGVWIQGNSNTWYLAASDPAYISGAYYHSNCGTPTMYVNLIQTSNAVSAGYMNGSNRLWEAKDISFSGWTNFGWLNYGSFEIAATVGAVLMYSRSLTADESALNFNALRGRFGI